MITLLLLILAVALIVIAVRLRRRRQRRRVMIIKLMAIIVLAIAVFFIVKYQPLTSRSSSRDGKFGSGEPSQMWDGLTARIESVMRFRLIVALALLASTSAALQADLTGQASFLSTVTHSGR